MEIGHVTLGYPGKTYRGTSLIRNYPSLGPYSRLMPRALWWSWEGGGVYIMIEVPLQSKHENAPLGTATDIPVRGLRSRV